MKKIRFIVSTSVIKKKQKTRSRFEILYSVDMLCPGQLATQLAYR